MPKVSVILPTYNRAHLFNRSIGSVLKQSFSDFELIVVDDCSTDNTAEVVSNFNDSRIKYIKHEKNLGPSVARNTGIVNALGEYIAFQDSDDEWVVDKLKIMINEFENSGNEIGLVYSKEKVIYPNTPPTFWPLEKVTLKDGNIFQNILDYNFIDTPASMIKKICIEKIGLFDPGFTCFEDYDFFLRLTKLYEVKFVDEVLLLSYATPGGVNSAKFNIQANMQIKILEKYQSDYLTNKNALASKYAQIGTLFSFDNNFNKAKKYFWKAFIIRMNRVDYLVRLIGAILSEYIDPRLYLKAKKKFLTIVNCICWKK